MSKELIEGVLIGVVGVAFLVVVALKLVRPRSTAFTVIAASAAVVVLAWGLTGQVYAAQGERDFSEFLDGGLPKPNDWVQEATNGGSVVVLGQQIIDATNIQLTEFFNPAIKLMWSLDGSAINVGGPILTPDPKGVDGTLTPVPGTQYVLAVNGLELQAPIVARRKDAVLYRIDGGPIKLKDALVGQQTDGWMVGSSEDPVARASYTRYDVSADGPGFASVHLSRENWCPRRDLRQTAKAIVRIGPVGIGPDKQPRIERVTETRRFELPDCEANGVTLTPPAARDGSPVPWRMEITVSPTFRPKDVDPSKSDSRFLGAQIKEARFQPLFGS